MTTVTTSSYTEGEPQPDGRAWVTETHLLSDGRDMRFQYLAAPEIDRNLVLSERVTRINGELAAREAAIAEAAQGEIPITKYEFRQLFTAAERVAIDAFNYTFESNPALTTTQKDQIRTALKDLEASTAVYLTNPGTVAGVNLYESLGLLAVGRAAEILS